MITFEFQEAKISNGGIPKKKPERSKESFEEVPLYTAVMTYLGFYLLMFLGYLNQLLFTPKVAREQNREVRKILQWSTIFVFSQK